MVGAVGGASRTGNDGRWWEVVGAVGVVWERWEQWEGVGAVGAVGVVGAVGAVWEIAPEPPKGDKLQVGGQVIGKR